VVELALVELALVELPMLELLLAKDMHEVPDSDSELALGSRFNVFPFAENPNRYCDIFGKQCHQW